MTPQKHFPIVVFLDSLHCLPFPFSSTEARKGDKEGKKIIIIIMGGLITAWGIAVFLSASLHPLIFKSLMLALPHPLFLLAGQPLYYSDKAMHVWAAGCVCAFGKGSRKCAATYNVCHMYAGGSHLPKLALIAPLIPKAIRDSAASSLSFNHSLHHWCNLSLAERRNF